MCSLYQHTYILRFNPSDVYCAFTQKSKIADMQLSKIISVRINKLKLKRAS